MPKRGRDEKALEMWNALPWHAIDTSSENLGQFEDSVFFGLEEVDGNAYLLQKTASSYKVEPAAAASSSAAGDAGAAAAAGGKKAKRKSLKELRRLGTVTTTTHVDGDGNDAEMEAEEAAAAPMHARSEQKPAKKQKLKKEPATRAGTAAPAAAATAVTAAAVPDGEADWGGIALHVLLQVGAPTRPPAPCIRFHPHPRPTLAPPLRTPQISGRWSRSTSPRPRPSSARPSPPPPPAAWTLSALQRRARERSDGAAVATAFPRPTLSCALTVHAPRPLPTRQTLAFALPVLDFLLRNWEEYASRVRWVLLLRFPCLGWLRGPRRLTHAAPSLTQPGGPHRGPHPRVGDADHDGDQGGVRALPPAPEGGGGVGGGRHVGAEAAAPAGGRRPRGRRGGAPQARARAGGHPRAPH